MFYLKCLESEEETFALIKREIDVRTRFILCNSENAQSSEWVKKEMDYISHKEPKRSFLKIDLRQSDDEITTQIDKYVRLTKVFLSYPHRLTALATAIYNRLCKYDFDVFYDLIDLMSGNFAMQLENSIVAASNSGFVIVLSDSDILTSWQLKEYAIAKKENGKVIACAMTSDAKAFFKRDLPSENVIHPDEGMMSSNVTDWLTDEILWRILPFGAIETFADNFRSGIGATKDEWEADRLDKLLIKKAEESSNPSALVWLAGCYEHGRHGLLVDLHQASSLLSEAIHVNGRNDLIPRARELNDRLNAMDHSKSP